MKSNTETKDKISINNKLVYTDIKKHSDKKSISGLNIITAYLMAKLSYAA